MAIKSGQRTFNFALKTKAENAEAVEAGIASHATFMKENHSLDSTKIQLEHYYTSKADELKNIVDPSEGTTGNVLYTINEVYTYAEGIGEHMDAGGQWQGMGSFLELLNTYGEVLVTNGEVVHHL